MKITWIKHGIAYRMPDDSVQVNEAFKMHPNLLNIIGRHEASHQPGAYTLHDFIHDLTMPDLRLLIFCILHPSTWTCILPVRRQDGIWYWDATMLIMGTISIIAGIYVYLIIVTPPPGTL